MNPDTKAVKQPTELGDRIKSKLATTGKLSVGDIAVAETVADDVETTESSSVNQNDPADLVTELATPDAGPQSILNATTGLGNDAQKVLDSIRDVEITEAEKNTFKMAVLKNERFRSTATALDGALVVEFQSRTLAETQAILARQRYEVNTGAIDNPFAYTARLRSLLLAAQVRRINDTEYPGLEQPLYAVVDPETKARTEPGWVAQADMWQSYNEAVHTIIWDLMAVFERKYMKMTEAAQNSDFWHPAASIS